LDVEATPMTSLMNLHNCNLMYARSPRENSTAPTLIFYAPPYALLHIVQDVPDTFTLCLHLGVHSFVAIV